MKRFVNLTTFVVFVLMVGFNVVFSQSNETKQNIGRKGTIDTLIPNIMSKKINVLKSKHNFKSVDLFEIEKLDEEKNVSNFAASAEFLKLDKKKLNSLMNAGYENIILRIPVTTQHNTELELTKTNVIANDFRACGISQKGAEIVDYKGGLYYQGIVKDDNQSIAAVSLFNDFIMCVFSDSKGGNYVLGSIEKNKSYTDNYILYNDENLLQHNNFECKVVSIPEARSNFKDEFDIVGAPVRIYFECDYQMFLDKGSVQNVINYVNGFYNSVSIIYNNTQIPTEISEISVWTTPDPYRTETNPIIILDNFRSNRQYNFNGNIAHFLTTRTNQFYNNIGGIAYLMYGSFPGLLCNQGYSFAWSNIYNTYNGYPTYSWTVDVVAHENGHIFGSPHTHSCCWPNGPFERCVPCDDETQMGCPTCNCPVQTIYNASIMSYCHLNGSISFTVGFGNVPGTLMRYNYNNNAGCVHNLCINGPKYISGSPPPFEGTYTITAPCNSPSPVEIQPGANVTFRAGTSILLLPGFTAHNSSIFTAYIQPYEPVDNFISLNMINGNIFETPVNKDQIPKDFSLSQNYPNPFNPTTLIKYGLKENINVKITIFDILGRAVKTLVNEFQPAGFKSIQWDGTNENNVSVSTGVYIYKIEAGNFVDSKKMVIIR